MNLAMTSAFSVAASWSDLWCFADGRWRVVTLPPLGLLLLCAAVDGAIAVLVVETLALAYLDA